MNEQQFNQLSLQYALHEDIRYAWMNREQPNVDVKVTRKKDVINISVNHKDYKVDSFDYNVETKKVYVLLTSDQVDLLDIKIVKTVF